MQKCICSLGDDNKQAWVLASVKTVWLCASTPDASETRLLPLQSTEPSKLEAAVQLAVAFFSIFDVAATLFRLSEIELLVYTC